MRWTIDCAGCGQSLTLTPGQQGRNHRCPNCQLPMLVGSPPTTGSLVHLKRYLRYFLLAGILVVSVLFGGGLVTRLVRFGADPVERLHVNNPNLAGNPMNRERGPMLGLRGEPPRLPRSQVPVDPPLELPNQTPLFLTDTSTTKNLSFVGRVPFCIASTIDPRNNSLFVAAADGSLSWYSISTDNTLAQVGSCRLADPAIHLLIDSQRDLLYAASIRSGSLVLGQLGDRDFAVCDVVVYDLAKLRATKSGDVIEPLRKASVEAHISRMTLTKDGSSLCFVAEQRQKAWISRLDTQTWTDHLLVDLPSGSPGTLSLAPEGTTMYALSNGLLLTFETATWRVTERLYLRGSIHSLVALSKGRVCLLERHRSYLGHLVDMTKRKTLATWQLDLEGRVYIATHPGDMESDKIYFSCSAVTSGRVWVVELKESADRSTIEPKLLARAMSDRQQLLRGPMYLGGNGKFVTFGAGLVYRTLAPDE